MATYSKSISFIGSNYDDMIHYISRVLVGLNKKICIIDLSKEQLFRYTLPEMKDNFICYRNIDIYTNLFKIEEMDSNEEYDIALIILEYNKESTDLFYESDYRVVSTDSKRANVIRLKQFLESMENDNQYDVIKILWDLVPCKINEKYINSLFKLEFINYLKEYNFYQEPEITAISVMNQYNDIFKFTKLDKDYKTMLNDLIEEWVGVDKKTLKKAYRLAERGK